MSERDAKLRGCEWFLLCDNQAVGTVAHPILGSVPTCQRCANKLGLTFEADEARR